MNENDKQAEPVAQPYAHIYEFDSAVFGTHRSFSPSQWNGMKPTRTVAVYTHPAQPVQPAVAQDYELALFEAKRIATGLWNKFYKNDAPNWELLPDLYGVISQISNMAAGLTRNTEAPAVAVDERLAASLKKANDQAEHFEREWYLRGDEIEALKAVNEQMLEALKLVEPCLEWMVINQGIRGNVPEKFSKLKAAIAAAEQMKGGAA